MTNRWTGGAGAGWQLVRKWTVGLGLVVGLSVYRKRAVRIDRYCRGLPSPHIYVYICIYIYIYIFIYLFMYLFMYLFIYYMY